MPAPYAQCSPGIVMMQNAATTGDGNILYLHGECRNVTIYLQSNGTTSGGTLSIEEAFYETRGGGTQTAGTPDPPYANTWSVIQSVNASTFSGNAQLAVHIAEISCMALKVRISSNITGGGTVTVWGWGN